jgi:hypothetical protein
VQESFEGYLKIKEDFIDGGTIGHLWQIEFAGVQKVFCLFQISWHPFGVLFGIVVEL